MQGLFGELLNAVFGSTLSGRKSQPMLPELSRVNRTFGGSGAPEASGVLEMLTVPANAGAAARPARTEHAASRLARLTDLKFMRLSLLVFRTSEDAHHRLHDGDGVARTDRASGQPVVDLGRPRHEIRLALVDAFAGESEGVRRAAAVVGQASAGGLGRAVRYRAHAVDDVGDHVARGIRVAVVQGDRVGPAAALGPVGLDSGNAGKVAGAGVVAGERRADGVRREPGVGALQALVGAPDGG